MAYTIFKSINVLNPRTNFDEKSNVIIENNKIISISKKINPETTLFVIVSKTFSKVYGMAGMRIGYLIAKPELANIIRANVVAMSNVYAIEGAKEALLDTDFYNFSIQKNNPREKEKVDVNRTKEKETGGQFLTVLFDRASRLVGSRRYQHKLFVRNCQHFCGCFIRSTCTVPMKNARKM